MFKEILQFSITGTIWNSVPLNKSGTLVNNDHAITVFAKSNTIMNGRHLWKWHHKDLPTLICLWLSFHNTTFMKGLHRATNC